jgi:photosystem II stability/assembly factor-like uncharacterized protein
MKITLPVLAVSVILAALCNIFPTQEKDKRDCESPSTPYDHFMQQRSWPDVAFDLEGYRQALEYANQKGMNKVSPPGFSDSWQLEGPTNIGGRINTIAIDPTDTNIIYEGSANGGIFKTTDNGATWNAIFDDKLYLGISYLLIDPKAHNTIYAATGDPNISGSPVIGNGIYKSTDAGKSWKNIGPTQGKIVSKILLNPDSQNVIYAACMGNPFGRDSERGLYKTSDGGKTWNKILYVDTQTGITDAVMDPKDSKTMYACAWTRIRTNRESTISSISDKIYKTTDGGNSWNVLANGLPSSGISRIGVSISQKNHNTLYAIVVDSASLDLSGIYKTTDAGKSWSQMPGTGLPPGVMGGFGWYFGKVYISPQDDSDIYFGAIDLYRYNDTTQSWRKESPPWYTYQVHADKHDLQWISPGRFLLGTDGGLYRHDVSSGMWEDADDVPNTQFYHIAINPFDNKNYYGGAQDNGSSYGNNFALKGWTRYWGGDGFLPAFDPTDSNSAYAETQNGNVEEINSNTGYNTVFSNKNNDKCNWDMPYIIDRFDHNILYMGTDKIYSNAGGSNKYDFRSISQNLTDSNIYGKVFHNMSALDQSSITKNIILAGTSDGNAWISRDHGATWDSITTGLPDRYITSIKTSALDSNLIYVSHSGYKYNEVIPHLHRSKNLGKSWVDISGDMPQIGINDILVYPNNDSIIFVATDAGVYGTTNAGTNWSRFGGNMPVFPVNDIEYNPVTHTLVAATFARSMMTYSLDNVLKNHGFYTSIVQAHDGFSVKVFPNPVKDIINISLGGLNYGVKVNVELYSLNGNLIRTASYISSSQIAIPAGELTPGSYFLLVKDGIKSKTVKILKL